MADEADIANERVELIISTALKVRRPIGPVPNGRCYNCAEPVADGLRWCDNDCRDDWQKRKDIRTRQFADGIPKPILDDDDEDDTDANL